MQPIIITLPAEAGRRLEMFDRDQGVPVEEPILQCYYREVDDLVATNPIRPLDEWIDLLMEAMKRARQNHPWEQVVTFHPWRYIATHTWMLGTMSS